ncbi:MAG: methionyl-tRNA formyltransferase [Actinomycetota bacterium]
MRLVFFGTPAPAAVALDALLRSDHEVAAVVTQPDRPRGRSGSPQPSVAKERAIAAGIPLLQPVSPRDVGFSEQLASYRPAVAAVVAYGHILPPEVLAVPPKGTVNVHFSLLPAYRGAAPVQRAIMAGETETGVTTFLLEPTLDTGPVLMQVRERIDPMDSSRTLLERLAPIGARVLIDTLDALEAGTTEPVPQDPSLASPAPKVKPEEGAIDWSRPAADVVNLIRAMDPAPGAFASFRGKRIKLWRARTLDGAASTPGSVLDAGKDRFVVSAGDGPVELLELQLEGAKRLEASAFVRGHRPKPDETLGAL